MVPSGDKEGSRHNRRHNDPPKSGGLKWLASPSPTPPIPPRESPGTELFAEKLQAWGVPLDDDDAKHIKKRLAKIRPVLSIEDQVWLLSVAEKIAEAEKAKAAYNPKGNRELYMTLCKTATAAARLSREIREMFPPPWTGMQASVGDLLAGLAAFIEGSFNATMKISKNTAVAIARATVRNMNDVRSMKNGRMYWELIQDLARLASGKKVDISERTVRRYLEQQRRSKSPARVHWRRNWKLLQDALLLSPLQRPSPNLLIPQSRSNRVSNLSDGVPQPPLPPRPVGGSVTKRQRKAIEAFTEVASHYLEGSVSSFTQVAKAAQRRS